MAKVILHIDLNAFFVTAEELRNPSLINKPVLIGHNGRKGIVSTCSYKAREYGIRSGMPTFQALKLCPFVIIVPPDMEYYRLLSNNFFNEVTKLSLKMEVTSIDECYLDITHKINDIDDIVLYLKNFQKELLKQTGLKCSIGVGPTKFLAKMGSDYKKPLGITLIRRKDIKEILFPLPIDNFYGIGNKTSPLLKNENILTIGELYESLLSNDSISHKILGNFSTQVLLWLKGYGDDEVKVVKEDIKSISHSLTLNNDTNDYNEIKNNIEEICNIICKRLIKDNKKIKTIQLTMKSITFKNTIKSKTLDTYTNDIKLIKEVAFSLLESFDLNIQYRLIGINVTKIMDLKEDELQLSVFDDFEEIEEKYATKFLIKRLNRKMNNNALITAGELKDKK